MSAVTRLDDAVCDYCAEEHAGECVRAKVILFRRDESAVAVLDVDVPDLSSSEFPTRELDVLPHRVADAGPHH